MAIVKFTENGYEYSYTGYRLSFLEDKAHNKLFDYVEADLSPISKLLEKYCSRKINLNTFVPSSSSKNVNELIKISTILTTAHPYYQSAIDSIIIKAIVEYFKQMLKYSIHTLDDVRLRFTLTEDWYEKQLVNLIHPLLFPKQLSEDPDDLWREYKRLNDNMYFDSKKDINEIFDISFPMTKPVPFESEIDTQNDIASMLYFILDADAEDINKLSLQQRTFLYSNIFHELTTTVEKLPIYEQRQVSSDGYYDVQFTEAQKIFFSLSPLRGMNLARESVPEKLHETLVSAVKFVAGIPQAKIYGEYEINSLRQLLTLEVLQMIQAGEIIRKCKNCCKYFVIKNNKIIYCNRIDKSGQICSDVGATRAFREKMGQDEALKIYTRAYKTHFARVTKGKMTQQELDDWRKEAKAMLKQVRRGELDIETFKSWLKK